jgi:hypothetical protein
MMVRENGKDSVGVQKGVKVKINTLDTHRNNLL